MTRRTAGDRQAMRAHLLVAAAAIAASAAPAARARDERPAPGVDARIVPQVPLPSPVPPFGEEPAPEPPTRPAAGEPCQSSRACAAHLGRGHVCVAGRCVEYFDRRDLYSVLGLRKAAPAGAPRPFAPLVAAIPVIGYSPASGLQAGLAGTVGVLLGDPADTTISSATGSLLVTTRKQLTLQVAATAMTSGNAWELLSDWRFLVYNQNTFGLGTGTTPLASGVSLGGWGELEAVPGAQPMDFNLLRLHQSALRHVRGSIYLGAGYRLDRHYDIVDARLDLAAPTPVVTSHFAYSAIEGFDPGAYTASGLSLEAISDSRDSTIAPYRGHYAVLRFTGYPTWLGSSRSATEVSAEARYYVGLSHQDPRNLLALWAIGTGVTSGQLPYLALPSSGWHARASTGRGYVQGRFRGTAMAYAEAEWRFRLTGGGLIGGTVFANAQTFSRPAVSLPAYGFAVEGEALFDTVRPAAGVGLRVMLLKQSRTSLRVDVAAGEDSICFYLGAGEAF
ncbi:MAG TPA: BamA/TamA family outer membrane protein [Anaeromyxobacter sp.]|nr:BamA/TamA family outer membrane protein [Anaeromyxobacter sp.]